MALTDDQCRRFDRDGFLVLDRILDAGEVARATGAIDRIYRGEYTNDRRPPRVRKPVRSLGTESSIRWMLNSRIVDQDVWDIATSPALGEIAADLLRTGAVSLVEDQLLDKPVGGSPVNLHQDYPYWPFATCPRLLTCWIALVDVTLEMGALQMIPGSHAWGPAVAPSELIDGSEADWWTAAKAACPQGASTELVSATVPAGGGVFFHCLTYHGSPRNRSTQVRRAMSLHWAAEDCRVKLAGTAKMDYPYFFARLEEGGRVVNSYMPEVYRRG